MKAFTSFSKKTMRRLTLSIFLVPMLVNLVVPRLFIAIEGTIPSNAIIAIRECILFATYGILYFFFYSSLIPNTLSCEKAKKEANIYLLIWATVTFVSYVIKFFSSTNANITNTQDWFYTILGIADNIAILCFFVLFLRKTTSAYKKPYLFATISTVILLTPVIIKALTPLCISQDNESGLSLELLPALGVIISWIFYYKLYKASQKAENDFANITHE